MIWSLRPSCWLSLSGDGDFGAFWGLWGDTRPLTARWHHQELSLWLWSMHHGESKPQISHSNILHTKAQKCRKPTAGALGFSFFSPLFFGLCPSLGTREGDPSAAGAGPGRCGMAVTGQAGTHQACLGWECHSSLLLHGFHLLCGHCKFHQ